MDRSCFFNSGSVPTVVISSAEAAKQVLKDHDLDCCSRPRLDGPGRISYNHLDIAFSPYNHRWKEMRKLCALELFGAKKARELQKVREEEVSSLVNSIVQSSGSGAPVDLTEMAFALNASVILKAAFGRAYCDHGSGFGDHKLHQLVEEVEAVMGSFFASDFFPYVGWIVDRLNGLHERLERSFNHWDAFYEYVIDYHRVDAGRRRSEQEDIVDVLLRIEGQQKESDAAHFTKDHIKAMLMDIFLAGVTSSAILIIWAMAELARNPRTMRKAQNEVRVLIGKKKKKGMVSEGDIDELQYLKMIVKETLRLHPPLPLLLSREVMSHFKLNGYDVHPKTRLEVNVWAIGRDPTKWKNPDEFYPERFADSSIDFKGNHFELLAFGAGRRGCPGVDMGVAIVELALANLLCCFDWELPNGMEEKDMDMEESPGLATPKKSPLQLVPIKFEWP